VPLPVKVVRYFNLPGESAVQVMAVALNSPAGQVGLLQGDLIVSLKDKLVSGVDDIHKILTRDSIGGSMRIVFLRNWTSRIERTVIPAPTPD
jgi:S1-C subfamily serine protease